MLAQPSSPTPDTAPSPRAQAARRAAEKWAEAVKAQSIYPHGHHRVRAALDEAAERGLPVSGLVW